MLRRNFLINAGLAPLSAPVAFATERLTTIRAGALRIGTYFVNPPFEFIRGGLKVGYEIDLMNDIARRLSLQADFVNTRWETILQELSEHKYDCIVGGITITAAREQTLYWSTPYLTTTLSLVVNAMRTPGIRQLADLRTAAVGVQAATTDYDIAVDMQHKGEIGKVVVYPFDKIREAIKDLEAGRLTAVMKVAPVADYLVSQTPGLKVIAQVPNDPQRLGIGFAKNGGLLRTAVNAALSSMHTDGTTAHLAQHWDIES